MSLNSSNLDAFYACAQLRSFTRAAERLHVTQSALSQRIKNLEEELALTLFIRERSGLRLTEPAEDLLRYCQTRNHIESDLLERIQGKDQKGLSGIVSIGGFSSVMRSVVLPALGDLLRQMPGIQIKLITRELYELPPLLKSGAIDFMISEEDLKQDGVVTRVLGVERNVLVQKCGYGGADIYLDHDENDDTTVRYLRKKSAARLQRRYLDDIYSLMDGVRLGWGKAVLPRHLVAQEPELEVIDPDRTLEIPVVLHHYEQPFYSRLHQGVLDALVRNCPRFLA